MSSPSALLTSPSHNRNYHGNPMTSRGRVVNVGSRASTLAMIQTESVVAKLVQFYPELAMPIQKITTTGDKILGIPLAKIGEKSLFTKELEVALEEGTVDFVVHSLKDLPTSLPPGMVIGAVLKRESPHDACIMSTNSLAAGFSRLSDLPASSIVGTSSLRRIAQLKRLHPGLVFRDVRGNLNTRMKKLDGEWEGGTDNYAALILAESGMTRMGWKDRITRSIPPEECMYAVGQGALAVECREDDFETLSILSLLHHESTCYRVVAERAMLKVLEGGCSAPVAVASEMTDDGILHLHGGVSSLDGTEAIDTLLSTDLSIHLFNEDLTTTKFAEHSKETKDGTSSSSSSSSSSKRRRSIRTYAGIATGSLNESAMDAAEKLGILVAKRLKKLGADPILKAAKEEVEQGREASERRKVKALEEEEAKKAEELTEKGAGRLKEGEERVDANSR